MLFNNDSGNLDFLYGSDRLASSIMGVILLVIMIALLVIFIKTPIANKATGAKTPVLKAGLIFGIVSGLIFQLSQLGISPMIQAEYAEKYEYINLGNIIALLCFAICIILLVVGYIMALPRKEKVKKEDF